MYCLLYSDEEAKALSHKPTQGHIAEEAELDFHPGLHPEAHSLSSFWPTQTLSQR